MEYDPRGQYGHLSGGQPPPPEPPAQPRPALTFGQVFWACFLALAAWSVLAYLVVAALIEQASSDF